LRDAGGGYHPLPLTHWPVACSVSRCSISPHNRSTASCTAFRSWIGHLLPQYPSRRTVNLSTDTTQRLHYFQWRAHASPVHDPASWRGRPSPPPGLPPHRLVVALRSRAVSQDVNYYYRLSLTLAPQHSRASRPRQRLGRTRDLGMHRWPRRHLHGRHVQEGNQVSSDRPFLDRRPGVGLVGPC
jgi:hypothetical protein